MTGERLNIPHELLFMAMHQKNRKGCLGLFAFAIAIKMYTGSSTLTNATPQKIRKVFKCGLAKATNLLEHAKRSSMFTMTKEGHLVARNLKKKFWTTFIYRHKKQHKLMVSKMERLQDIRLSEIEKELNRLAIRATICAKERRHELTTRKGNTSNSRRCELSIDYFAKVLGLSNRQVIRILNDMKDNREIIASVNKHREFGDDSTYVFKGVHVWRTPNAYYLLKKDEKKLHGNLVFEHCSRRGETFEQTHSDH